MQLLTEVSWEQLDTAFKKKKKVVDNTNLCQDLKKNQQDASMPSWLIGDCFALLFYRKTNELFEKVNSQSLKRKNPQRLLFSRVRYRRPTKVGESFK